MRRQNKIHLSICLANWLLWTAGIIMIGIGRGDIEFFFKVASLYNSVVLPCSVLPVEPIFFVVSTVKGIARKEPFKLLLPGIILFISNAVAWLAYISLFIMMTGGV